MKKDDRFEKKKDELEECLEENTMKCYANEGEQKKIRRSQTTDSSFD